MISDKHQPPIVDRQLPTTPCCVVCAVLGAACAVGRAGRVSGRLPGASAAAPHIQAGTWWGGQGSVTLEQARGVGHLIGQTVIIVLETAGTETKPA